MVHIQTCHPQAASKMALGMGHCNEAKCLLLSALAKAALSERYREPTWILGEQSRIDMTREKFGEASLTQQFLFLIYLSWLTRGKQRTYQGHAASLSLSLFHCQICCLVWGLEINVVFFFSSKWIKLSGDGWWIREIEGRLWACSVASLWDTCTHESADIDPITKLAPRCKLPVTTSPTCCIHCILFRDFCILVPFYAKLAYVSKLHFLSNSLHPLRCPCFSFSHLKQVPSSPSSSSLHLPGWPANLNEKKLQQHSLCHCKLRKAFPLHWGQKFRTKSLIYSSCPPLSPQASPSVLWCFLQSSFKCPFFFFLWRNSSTASQICYVVFSDIQAKFSFDFLSMVLN